MVELSKIAEIAIPVGLGLFILALVIGGVSPPGAPPSGKTISISNIIIE